MLVPESKLQELKDRRQFHEKWEKGRMPHEVKNAFDNYHWIKSQWQETMFDLTQMVEPKAPAFVCGSGSSLDQARRLVLWKGSIWCNDSQAATLMYYGAPPTYVCLMDARTNTPSKMAVKEWDPKCRTVFTPTVQRRMIDVAPGVNRRSYVFRLFTQSTPWYMYLSHAYDFITSIVRPYAASQQAAVSMAQALGHTPIFLIGGGMGEKRAEEWRYLAGKWRSNRQKNPFLHIKGRNGQKTSVALLHHKLSLLTVAFVGLSKKTPREAIPIQTSKEGILTELPYVPLEEVIEKQGKIDLPPEVYDKAIYEIELYMVSKDQYWIPCGNGVIPKGGIVTISDKPYVEIKRIAESIDADVKRVKDAPKVPDEAKDMNLDWLYGPDSPAFMAKIEAMHKEIVARGWWKKNDPRLTTRKEDDSELA